MRKDACRVSNALNPTQMVDLHDFRYFAGPGNRQAHQACGGMAPSVGPGD